ncbi:hypothetical protein [uncultured Selenomonas sp.]|uniref:hypothetical protein n=1 Tax=uncultured Selenomonas sp. TaxID=159275 RepID=UPI0025FA677A|nr:hypothetical protein [uncultured Selenomonas sp.]
MEAWKKNLMLISGSALTMLILSLLKDDEKGADEPLAVDERGLMRIVDAMREKAEQAMDACQTAEEREAVFGEIEKNIQNLQQNMQEKSADILQELHGREQPEETEEAPEDANAAYDGTFHAESTEALHVLEQSAQDVIDGLDDVLASLRTRKEGV